MTSYLHLFPHVAALGRANLHRATAVIALSQQAESLVPQHHIAHPSALCPERSPDPGASLITEDCLQMMAARWKVTKRKGNRQQGPQSSSALLSNAAKK